MNRHRRESSKYETADAGGWKAAWPPLSPTCSPRGGTASLWPAIENTPLMRFI